MNKINEILKNSDYSLTIFDKEKQWLENRLMAVDGKKGTEYKPTVRSLVSKTVALMTTNE